jgi:nucleotide-binding universal stress UspA family protein
LRELTSDDAGSSHPVERRVAFGEPDHEVLAVAAGEGADLIVMGARRGSPSLRTVVRNAACPVLVIPAGHIWPERGLAPSSETVGATAAR